MDNKDSSSASLCDQTSPFAPCIVESMKVVHAAPSTISHKRKAGRRKFRETRHPIHRGVRQRNGNKWVCEIREPNKKSRIWLGTFSSPETAARAHDVAALALRGKFASLNFLDSAWLLPLAKSSSAGDIQTAALEAARVSQLLPTTSSSSPSSPSSPIKKAAQEPSSSMNLSPVNDSIQKFPELSITTTLCLDEEALFDMPGFINSMAEGLLLTPPAMRRGFKWDDDMACDMDDLTLWKN